MTHTINNLGGYVRAVYANALGSKVSKHFICIQRRFLSKKWPVVRCLIMYMIYEHAGGSRMKQLLPPFGWRNLFSLKRALSFLSCFMLFIAMESFWTRKVWNRSVDFSACPSISKKRKKEMKLKPTGTHANESR